MLIMVEVIFSSQSSQSRHLHVISAPNVAATLGASHHGAGADAADPTGDTAGFLSAVMSAKNAKNL